MVGKVKRKLNVITNRDKFDTQQSGLRLTLHYIDLNNLTSHVTPSKVSITRSGEAGSTVMSYNIVTSRSDGSQS